MLVNELRDKHLGQPIVICGCGHSLTPAIAKKLIGNNVLTIGVNSCFRMLPTEDFYPTYHLFSDYQTDFVCTNEYSLIDMDNTGTILVMPDLTLESVAKRLSNKYVYSLKRDCDGARVDPYSFISSWDDTKNVPACFGRGYTAIFTAIQLALYMGCGPLYLIGVDFTTKSKKGGAYMHPYDGGHLSKNEARRWGEVMFPAKVGQFRNTILPALKRLNKTVFNCSPISALDMIPFLDIDIVIDMMKREKIVKSKPVKEQPERQPVRELVLSGSQFAEIANMLTRG